VTEAPADLPRPGLLPIFGEKPKDPFVVVCTPTIKQPFPQYLDALEASVEDLDAAGIRHATVASVGSPYISCARAEMLRKAMDAKADIVVFIDHDLSWDPEDLRLLIETEGDVVCGTYRFKMDEESYMGTIHVDAHDRPQLRKSDGAIRAKLMPAGFLKVTKEAVHRFMEAYPELCFGPKFGLSVDLFNHGAHDGQWWGEDYAFCRRWGAIGGDVWCVPDLNLTHHHEDGRAFPGNFMDFFMRRPGGAREGEAPWWDASPTRSAA
jgi:hypothetical protein